MRGIHSSYKIFTAIAAAVIKTTTTTGTAVDLANTRSNFFSVNVGVITDGTHTAKLQDSPDNSTWTDVDSTLVLGTPGALVSATNAKFSYIGAQRYVRLVVTVTGSPSTGGYYSAVCIAQPRVLPAS
jgi:hypothetical protein